VDAGALLSIALGAFRTGIAFVMMTTAAARLGRRGLQPF
jgi:hypothetical protein